MSVPEENSRVWKICKTAEETISAARELALSLPKNSTVALHGDLGAGKTTFVQGFADAFGIAEQITSPSYNIYTIYEARERQLIHMDAYRLPSPRAAEALMLDEFLREPWCLVVEWPEKLGDFLPAGTIHVFFEIVDGNARCLRIAGTKNARS